MRTYSEFTEAKIVGHVKLSKSKSLPPDALSRQDIRSLEAVLDSLFSKVDLDINIHGKHFIDRVNDWRNKNQITVKELNDIFRGTFKKYGKQLSTKKQLQAVLVDIQSKINVPFLIKYDKKEGELSIVAKTVMRKADFKTSNKKYRV